MTIEPRYIGDGVYVSHRDGMLVLTTDHHEPMNASNTIYLEPEIVLHLIEYIEEVRKEHRGK